ncbi:hypothetical protein FALBO_10552 [Fusarium albosuccineum]|uniref:Uncharacterized protein n=1 Tax=Fusarium albosuccineum TaxID=1237068 RepID=A0A8H4PAX2_9HYPO|nr:hypothetical protein FALBO_10552 [Fusarium albosuccineum]
MDSNRIATVIERPLPNGVIYDLLTAGQVTITLPKTSTWSSGLHWHETHTEYLKVIKGTIRVRLGDTVQTVTATGDEQPELKVARYQWHEWQRAGPDGDDVVVIERTEPNDNEKAIFFWNLNGVILNTPKMLNDPKSLASRLPSALHGLFIDFWITLNLFVIFRHLDNVPVFLNAPSFLAKPGGTTSSSLQGLDWVVSHLVLYVASWLGWVFGVRPVRLEFTPADIHNLWWSRREDTKKTT